ncbi:MAG: CotH kinase family protein [Ruminococcus sp.]|nr:CotH kinase family protein [Ruminococcus sp.]
MKKTLSILLAALMLFSVVSLLNVSAETVQSAPTGFKTWKALFAHAVSGSEDGEAWVAWQSKHNQGYGESNSYTKYFFLPSSTDSNKVDVYNAFSSTVTVNGTEIASGKTATVSFETGKSYSVKADNNTYTLQFMRSGAEAAIYVNNSDADGNGTGLMDYLKYDKSRSAKATGAIVTPDGKIDNTAIKKIKGRGNTTWDKSKKPFNITYDSKVSIAGMSKGKKYSILANYQDDSLSRNRFLYDLSDAVDMPYASDSRYVDFYVNGFYWGSYQMSEKIEAGSSSLVSDFEEDDYLSSDGLSVNEDFPFIAEVDGSAGADDYYVTITNGINITIKAPELAPGDVGYDEVKKYVKDKFTQFYNATATETTGLSKYADIDSLAKLYLINELGKNWDSGASSIYFTYKPDENGTYKFYGSPVWDYDNSLGNATGVWSDLNDMGVSDYEEYTGWWCKYKGKSANQRESSNIINRLSVNTTVFNAAKTIWKEKFIPAINHFAGTAVNKEIGKELYTADEYYNLIKDSAAMNYTSGWLLNTGSWIADHTSLKKATYDASNNTYSVSKSTTRYSNNFEGMYNYCRDWMISRAAWLSNEMVDGSSVVEPTVDPTKAQRIYFDNSSYNWKKVYVYVYNDNREQNADWPGVEMQYDSQLGLYYYDVPEEFAYGYAMFTESGTAYENRYPADGEPGMPLEGKSMIFGANHKWTDDVPEITTAPTEPTTESSVPTEPKVYIGIYGDANCDGDVDISDVTTIQKYLASLGTLGEKYGEVLADVDGDDDVNIKDATYIQMYVAKLNGTKRVGEQCYN